MAAAYRCKVCGHIAGMRSTLFTHVSSAHNLAGAAIDEAIQGTWSRECSESVETRTEAPKLIPCPDCGKQVSARAATCPNCGCPISRIASETARPSESTHSASAIRPGTSVVEPRPRPSAHHQRIFLGIAFAVLVLPILSTPLPADSGTRETPRSGARAFTASAAGTDPTGAWSNR